MSFNIIRDQNGVEAVECDLTCADCKNIYHWKRIIVEEPREPKPLKCPWCGGDDWED